MKMQEKKIGLLPALLVAVLSFGGFVAVATIVSHNDSGLTPISFAKDGEDDEDSDSDEDKNDDEDKKDDKESKSEKDAKKKAEREREDAKKSAERAAKSSDDNDDEDDDMVNGVKVRGDGSVDDEGDDDSKDEDELDDDRDDNGMYKDRTKTLSKLEKELAEAEKDILEKQAEGVDVTAALARLAQAKAKVAGVGSAFDANDLEMAKDLAQEVKKMAHFAKENDLHDAKEAAEDVAKIAKRITQAYGKIALLVAVGGNGETFKATLASYESDFMALKATIAAGNYDSAMMESSLETLERKVKRLKSSIEGAIYALGGTDNELDDDLEDESDDIAEHLNDVADIEDDNVGHAIRGIADDHKDATKKISEVVKSVDKRNPVLQALFGANSDDLNDLEREVVGNKARTAVLLQAANTIDDQDIKSTLLDQVATLKEQTAKLEIFVSGQRDRLSLFGWFFNLGQ